MSSSFSVASPDSGPDSSQRLDSWKEIAAFFKRGERTVKRWESERGLPVHRVPGVGRSAVFAYTYELAAWMEGRDQELASGEPILSASSEEAEPEVVPSCEDVTVTLVDEPSSARTARLAKFTGLIVLLLMAAGTVAYLAVRHPRFGHRVFARHVPNQEAQQLYLKGRYYWNRRTPDDLTTAVDYFTQAIVKDPGDTEAYVGLADCYNLLREFGAMPAAEAYTRALSAAQRAVQLDDSSAEAHTALAFSTFWWSWKGATAEREFKRALQLDPNLVRAHHWYATFLLALRRYPEALSEIEKAQRLQPSASTILADKGFLLTMSGRQDEGLALLEQLESSEPSLSSTHDYLGRIFWRQSNYEKALGEWRQSAELRHDRDALRVLEAGERGLAANGLRGLYESEVVVQQEIVDRGAGSAYALALSYAALGKKQEAVSYLQMSFDRHESGMLVSDPPIPELQNDPGYQALRARASQLRSQ